MVGCVLTRVLTHVTTHSVLCSFLCAWASGGACHGCWLFRRAEVRSGSSFAL